MGLDNQYPVANFTLYNTLLAWGGFQEIDGQPFTVNDTPEPGTLIMFGSGILGLAGVLRRKVW